MTHLQLTTLSFNVPNFSRACITTDTAFSSSHAAAKQPWLVMNEPASRAQYDKKTAVAECHGRLNI
jgi:hypothetical protein